MVNQLLKDLNLYEVHLFMQTCNKEIFYIIITVSTTILHAYMCVYIHVGRAYMHMYTRMYVLLEIQILLGD